MGAGTTVDRATLGETRIKAFTKIDNQVQIAHNVTIERNCLIASQVGIAGSARPGGKGLWRRPGRRQDHARVGAHSILMAQSGITCDLAPKTIWVGTPGMPHKELTRNRMYLKKKHQGPEGKAEHPQQPGRTTGRPNTRNRPV
ncbi:MAG: hypothetical protein R2857_07010 [Vampirovibrionales bacterium]